MSSGTSPAASCARSKRLSGRDGSCGNRRYGPSGSSPSRCRASARGIGWKRSRSTPQGRIATRRVRPAPGMFSLNARETAAGSAMNGSAARVNGRERGCSRSLPCSVTTQRAQAREQRGPGDEPEVHVHDVELAGLVAAPQLARGTRVVARPGGEKWNSSTSTSPRRCSASTWSRTNGPEAGRSGVGYMFVTTSARTAGRAYALAARFRHRRVWIRHTPLRRLRSRLRRGRRKSETDRRRRWVTRRWARRTPGSRARGRAGGCWGEGGQGTVEYVGLILLVAVILAGVVKASGSFSDKGIADAVVKKLKAAIDGVGEVDATERRARLGGVAERALPEELLAAPGRSVRRGRRAHRPARAARAAAQ